jgi:predicted AlkP superfamily pyrophosphatase or phosphodiesterase
MAGLAAPIALLALLPLIALLGIAAKPFNPNAPKKPPPAANGPKPTNGPGVPGVTRRVIVVSLDGAGAEALQQMWHDDVLDEGGFERFFREGLVASSLVPVDPTLTAANHTSLATGASPDHTGIVGNHFHVAGTPLFEKASGFSVPVGAETLWEALRRQKKTTAVLAWPGADGTSARRRGDIGMTYVTAADREPQMLTLERGDWQPAGGKAPKLASKSPLLTAHVILGGTGKVDATGFDLYALDRTDDERENYDGVVVAATLGGAQASVANLQQSEPLRRGEWAEISFPDRGGRSICWVKILSMDAALGQVRLYFSGTYPLPAFPASYAKDLAESNLAWPGPPDDRRLLAGWKGDPAGIDLQTWTEQAERYAAFFGGAIRVAAARDDWDLILAYIPVIDEAGHALMLTDSRQAGYSDARRDELARARRKVWQAVDRELRLLAASLDLGRTTLVVVSDHGMAPVHTAIDLNALLRERGLLASAGGSAAGSTGIAYAIADGGIAHLYLAEPNAAIPTDPAERQRLLADLRDQLLAWRLGDDTPIERVLTRQEATELGLDHPNSGDLIVFARGGYMFDGGPAPAGTPLTHPAGAYGMHGHLASHPDMQGIYMALGKDIKLGITSGPVQAVDVASRVAAWLGVEKPRAVATEVPSSAPAKSDANPRKSP